MGKRGSGPRRSTADAHLPTPDGTLNSRRVSEILILYNRRLHTTILPYYHATMDGVAGGFTDFAASDVQLQVHATERWNVFPSSTVSLTFFSLPLFTVNYVPARSTTDDGWAGICIRRWKGEMDIGPPGTNAACTLRMMHACTQQQQAGALVEVSR